MRRLIDRARPRAVTCHKAIDATRDPLEALEALLALGVDRVLTSGGADTAAAGAATIARMVARAGAALTVMAGGGVRAGNVRALVGQTASAKYTRASCRPGTRRGRFRDDRRVGGRGRRGRRPLASTCVGGLGAWAWVSTSAVARPADDEVRLGGGAKAAVVRVAGVSSSATVAGQGTEGSRGGLRAFYQWLTGSAPVSVSSSGPNDPTGEVARGGTPAPGGPAPARIGHYRIERKIGEGGMGVVYAARDERLNRTIALKTLSAPAPDETARQRLWREARAAASVNHPNVCQIHEIGEDAGRCSSPWSCSRARRWRARLDRGR